MFTRIVQRKDRYRENYSCFFLPSVFMVMHLMNHLSIGFLMVQLLAAGNLWSRVRDRSADPEIEETYLRALMEDTPEITKNFNVDTMHVLDHDVEYSKFPCNKEFPEFDNKLFRFFNADSNMTEGYFVFGDLESNATLKVKFNTMPVVGKSRFSLGEPFFYFDVTASMNCNGVHEEITIVDREKTLKKVRPFLMML